MLDHCAVLMVESSHVDSPWFSCGRWTSRLPLHNFTKLHRSQDLVKNCLLFYFFRQLGAKLCQPCEGMRSLSARSDAASEVFQNPPPVKVKGKIWCPTFNKYLSVYLSIYLSIRLEYQTTLTLNQKNNHGGICTVYFMSTCLLQTKCKAILGVLPY